MSAMIKLNNGLEMPSLGLGTWKSQPGEVRAAVYEAIKVGYRHIDCAWIYKNQDEVGEAIAQAIADGMVTRGDLWVTSKLWNSFHEPSQVEAHCRESLAQLRLSYLDLFLIHWPVVTDCVGPELKPTIEETWVAMEKLVELGLTKTIGVSNFTVKKLEDMKRYAKIFPAVNQVELHPMLRQDDLLNYCAAAGVSLSAYSPLGSPDSAAMTKREGPSVMSNPTLVEVANECGKSVADVCIRWAVQRGTSVLPKSVTASRIASNFDNLSWTLAPEQFAKVNSIEPQVRMLEGWFFVNPEGPYKTVNDLWDV